MRVIVMKNDILYPTVLPVKIKGNIYLYDYQDNQKRSLLMVEARDNKWFLKSNSKVHIVQNNMKIPSIVLEEYHFYTVQTSFNSKNELIWIYCEPTIFPNALIYTVPEILNIGQNPDHQIIIHPGASSYYQLQIRKQNNRCYLEDLGCALGVYVNDERVKNKWLESGDRIFVAGIHFVLVGTNLIIPNTRFPVEIKQLIEVKIPKYQVAVLEDKPLLTYQNEEYFSQAPRFRTSIEEEQVIIDLPPAKQQIENMPFIYTMGPMITMGMTSMVMGFVALNGVLNGKQDWSSATPSLIICVSMLMSMILWPLLTKNYQKKQALKKEELRQEKYSNYLNDKKKVLELMNHKQRQILLENHLSLEECEQTIIRKDRNLWVRNPNHDDFLMVRLGIGNVPLKVKLNCPEEHFYLEEDNLKSQIDSVIHETNLIEKVPVCTSLKEKNFSALVGNYERVQLFAMGMLLQLVTLHSYLDVKIVILTTEEHKSKWQPFFKLPHIFNNEKNFRFLATNEDETLEVTRYLEQELYLRTYQDSNNQTVNYRPYYVIFTDNYKNISNHTFFLKLLSQKNNVGFSLVILSNRLNSLPSECNNFITIGEKESGVFENELVSDKQKRFQAEYPDINRFSYLFSKLQNIPLETNQNIQSLPDTLSFLDMYGVLSTQELNVLTRWKKSDPTISLAAPIGMEEHGEIFKLDLHEKYHGPHGLIAGMTGSGKSEFIITFILSLAIQYHPYEVSFVLIDYKGGGLAGAFYNKETGVVLPHLAGVITNLDTASMNRALASIQSELKRRQRLFNEARDLLNEGTIDIYKYQRLYRGHLVKEPVSHLFIVSDEFAELKAQRPEFMDELISTARIGRSLGVHLILATQKPSGIVNEQIWSNSRFRVCLKVQEKEDSMDVIKSPDAAYLKETGRFYLQVGYNELFLLGQSAYTGLAYNPDEKNREKMDMTIEFITNTGNILKQIDDSVIVKNSLNGEELVNIVNYLYQVAKIEQISIPKLWLDPIPEFIRLDSLKDKYQYQPQLFILKPIIGEYDDPLNQQQHLLTLSLLEGNIIIYGAPNSGKEQVLQTLIYGLITNHSSLECQLYLLDFGSEMLRMFSEAPQVGDVVTLNETDKIVNLFKWLKEEIDKRKQVLVAYNGNYEYYIKNCPNPLPYLVIMMNNYDAFKESYENLEDIFHLLTREGTKYGIVLVITTSSSNGVSFKTKQNFKQEIVLNFNSPDDYAFILGNTKGMEPSPYKGRGLIKIDQIYEFQTASITDSDSLSDFVKNVCQNLVKSMIKAPRVPVLPDTIKPSYFTNISLDNVPIGIEKESLKTATISLEKRYTTLVTGYDPSLFSSFIGGMLEELKLLNDYKIIVLDLENWLFKVDKIIYIDNKLNEFIDKIKQKITTELNIYQNNGYQKDILKNYEKIIVFISGIGKLKERIPDFGSILERGKDLGTIHFVLIDTIDNFSKMEFESWYKTVITNNTGIWLGNGITDQYTLKLSKTPRSLYEEIPQSFGYLVKRGIPILTKMVSKEEEDE